jgi:hypothetical protein
MFVGRNVLVAYASKYGSTAIPHAIYLTRGTIALAIHETASRDDSAT